MTSRQGIDIQWYPRRPREALETVGQLTLEEIGAEALVTDLIYLKLNDLHDDPKFIARNLGCDVRVWKRLRDRLLDTGRLYVDKSPGLPDRLCSKEADEGVDVALARIAAKRYAGAQSAAAKAVKSNTKSNRNNGFVATSVATPVGTGVQHTNNNNNKSNTERSSLPPAVAPSLGQKAAPAASARLRWGPPEDYLRARLTDLVFDKWFGDARLEPGPPTRLIAPKPFQASWIRSQFASAMQGAFPKGCEVIDEIAAAKVAARVAA